MNGELIAAIIFYTVLGMIIYKNRSKLQIISKVFFVFKLPQFVKYFHKFAKPTWLWKILSTISIPVCLFFMIYSVNIMIDSAMYILDTPDPTPTVVPLIPGVQIPGSPIFVPFWYGIISIIILSVVHEGFHGIVGSSEKLKIKDTGVGLLLVLPLAFVEFDVKNFMKSKRLSRIRALCAGSFGNFIVAILSFVLVIYCLSPIVDNQLEYTNVIISSTVSGEPANLAGVPDGSLLYSINNNSISNMTVFYEVLTTLNPGENITLGTSNGTYYLNTISNPSNESMAYLGVMAEQDWDFKQELQVYPEFLLYIPIVLMQLFMWVSNLNFAVGIFNLYPLWITDGGKVLIDVLGTVIKNEKVLNLVVNSVFYFALSVLLFNIFAPYFL